VSGLSIDRLFAVFLTALLSFIPEFKSTRHACDGWFSNPGPVGFRLYKAQSVRVDTRNGRTCESHSPPRGKLKPGRFPSMSLEDGLLNENSILLGLSFIRRPDRSPVIRIHKARRGRQTCEHRYSIVISNPGSVRPEVLIWTADCRRFVLFTYLLPTTSTENSFRSLCVHKQTAVVQTQCAKIGYVACTAW
jgi:hypothetical protein